MDVLAVSGLKLSCIDFSYSLFCKATKQLVMETKFDLLEGIDIDSFELWSVSSSCLRDISGLIGS